MRFAHIADAHLGGWREPKLKALSQKAFELAISKAIEAHAKFLIISGDLFNTSLPSIDTLKLVVQNLKRLKDKRIPVYAIAGSHDFSPSGKTMLDRSYYERLDRESLKKEAGTKLFLFHTAISEYKPKSLSQMPSMPLSFLPEGFAYYAGGHVHEAFITQARGEGWIVMPGPVFPNNFSELEKLESGSMIIVEFTNGFKPELMQLKVIEKKTILIELDGKSPEQANTELFSALQEVQDKLVLIRLTGTLAEGRLSELKFQEAFSKAYSAGAYLVLKNSSKAQSKEFEALSISVRPSEDIEARLIAEHSSGQFEDEAKLVKALLNALSQEKLEGETRTAYEERIKLAFNDATKSI